MMEKPKHLSDVGLKLGDIVMFSSDKESTGGVLYTISEDTEPVEGAVTTRKTFRDKKEYNYKTNQYEMRKVEDWESGAWAPDGTKIMVAAVTGFVRIKPLFEFFATRKGKKPKGKDTTIIIYYNGLDKLKKLELIELGTKYVELGNIIKSLAVSKGMENL